MFKAYQLEHSLDDPRTSLEHRNIILNKPFLKKLYEKWYDLLLSAFSDSSKVLEIGSGGGFLKDRYPNVVTSDIQPLSHVDMVVNAEVLPFKENELDGIVMLNVFHHVPNPALFLKEAERVLKNGGIITMIEPANSLFGRFIYQNFHHEPFLPEAGHTIKAGNPMSNSNQALPYIYFERDANFFNSEFPTLKIRRLFYHSPLQYIVSGGVSREAMLPMFMFPVIEFFELLLRPVARIFGLFCYIEVEKIS